MGLRRERVKRPVDECDCDWCGCPIGVGDTVYYDLDRGAAYCCRECGQSDAFDAGYGNGGTVATMAEGGAE